MTRPVLLTENSRTELINANEDQTLSKLAQFVAAFVSTISAICLGMVFSWTSSALVTLTAEIGITQIQGAWIGSLVTLGAFVGAIPAGPLANKFGRKSFLQVVIIPLFLSWILIAYLYHHVWVVYLARFLAGLSGGAVSVAAPMYVAELAHVSIRGTLGTFFQVQITVGILIGYLMGGMITDIRTLSLSSSVLPVVFMLCFVFIPESPVFLCSKDKMEEARQSLIWFRGEIYEIEDELAAIVDDLKESKKNQTKLSDLVRDKATVKALIIALGLMIFQQLSGVNAVLFYANNIFENSGSSLSPSGSSILIGIVQVLATLGSTILIDRAGRKLLLVVSEFVMTLSIASLGSYFYLSQFRNLSDYSFIPLVSVAVFIISFSIGIGPIPWMIMGELFTPDIKGPASSISASLNWFLAFTVTNQFANMTQWFGTGGTFLMFALVCAIGTAFISIMLPETKGKSLEEVRNELLGVRPPVALFQADFKCERMTSFV
ncbi:facilitated trehalose transporter Tret1-like [Cylas formicarius]|uniref:facilitated trehalose transporter Tret1-like n=1 Tax=Cylas formicarius TaxID=197179 RepID=UPI0029589AA3|nr:facilitated trehalose transporter Tret1-like [Cylas formicarius]